jgi:hypothetical protein
MFWTAACFKRPIVTRARAPRQVAWAQGTRAYVWGGRTAPQLDAVRSSATFSAPCANL